MSRPSEEAFNMQTSKAALVFLIGVIVTVAATTIGVAGDGPKLPVKRYEGSDRSCWLRGMARR
jgi:hypothetical protein